MSLVFPTPAIHILEIAGGEASNEEQSERCTRGTVMRDEEKSKATMPPSLFSPFLSAKQTCPPLSGGEKKLIIACEIAFVATLMLFLSFQNRGLFPTFLVVSALLWQQKKSWSTVGFARPTSWRRALGAGLGLCGIWFVLQIFGLEPLVAILIHQRPDVQAFSSLHGHPLNVVGSLLIAWTSSAFGEEMLFRGYLLNRFADLFGRSYPGWTVSILAQARPCLQTYNQIKMEAMVTIARKLTARFS